MGVQKWQGTLSLSTFPTLYILYSHLSLTSLSLLKKCSKSSSLHAPTFRSQEGFAVRLEAKSLLESLLSLQAHTHTPTCEYKCSRRTESARMWRWVIPTVYQRKVKGQQRGRVQPVGHQMKGCYSVGDSITLELSCGPFCSYGRECRAGGNDRICTRCMGWNRHALWLHCRCMGPALS